MGLISGPGKSPGVGSGNPLQNSCLENPVDSGAQGLQAMEATETQRGLRTQYTQKVSGRAQTPAGELWPSHWCTALHLHHLRVCVCFGGLQGSRDRREGHSPVTTQNPFSPPGGLRGTPVTDGSHSNLPKVKSVSRVRLCDCMDCVASQASP